MKGDILNIILMTHANGNNTNLFLEKRFRDFEKRENIKVNVKFVSWNRAYETIVSSFKKGNPPDVFQLGTTWIRTLAHLNYIAPITIPIKTNHSVADWINMFCEYQGERIAVPWVIDTNVMIARQDILDKFNIKAEDIKDWEGFLQVCSKLIELNKDNKSPKPLSLSIRPGPGIVHYFSSWLFAGGWDYPKLKPIPDKILTKKEFLEVFNYMSRLMKVCNFTVNTADEHPYQLDDNYYNKGAGVFYIGGWNSIVQDIFNQQYSDNNRGYRFFPYPIPYLNSNLGTYGGGSVLTVSSRTKHSKKAWKLVELMVSNEFANDWLEVTSGVPAFESDFWQRRFSDKRVRIIYELTLNSKSYPRHPSWTRIEAKLSNGISNCLWKIIEELNSSKGSNFLSILQKNDRQIIDMLKMLWEMNINE